MDWRIIPLSINDAFLNMAIDESIMKAIQSGNAKPTVRFYRWQPSAVSIGCFQSLEEEVDANYCKQEGFDVVRRRTGGGAVFHDYNGEITYSVIAPQEMFPLDLIESYKRICGWIIDSLRELGLETNFVPINDILLNGKKISGNAQTRRNKVLLQHGTILFDLNIETMFSCLKVPKEKISDKMIQSVKERVTCIKTVKPEITMQELYEALVKGFSNGKKFEFEELSIDELNFAKELAEKQYSAREWNYSR